MQEKLGPIRCNAMLGSPEAGFHRFGLDQSIASDRCLLVRLHGPFGGLCSPKCAASHWPSPLRNLWFELARFPLSVSSSLPLIRACAIRTGHLVPVFFLATARAHLAGPLPEWRCLALAGSWQWPLEQAGALRAQPLVPITPNVKFSGPPGPYHKMINARSARAGPLQRVLGSAKANGHSQNETRSKTTR